MCNTKKICEPNKIYFARIAKCTVMHTTKCVHPKQTRFLNDSLNSSQNIPVRWNLWSDNTLRAIYIDITVKSDGPSKHVKSEPTTNRTKEYSS